MPSGGRGSPGLGQGGAWWSAAAGGSGIRRASAQRHLARCRCAVCQGEGGWGRASRWEGRKPASRFLTRPSITHAPAVPGLIVSEAPAHLSPHSAATASTAFSAQQRSHATFLLYSGSALQQPQCPGRWTEAKLFKPGFQRHRLSPTLVRECAGGRADVHTASSPYRIRTSEGKNWKWHFKQVPQKSLMSQVGEPMASGLLVSADSHIHPAVPRGWR